MAVIKFTGSLNDELDDFFRNFGYTQEIPWRASNYSGITTENQFDPQYMNHFIRAEFPYYNIRTGQREPIPEQNERDFDPYYRADLWDVWTNIQEKDLNKIKFYLVDNKLLFFWLPRTGRDYKFRAVSRGWSGGQFSKSGGSWFCLHRSAEPDEEGNYPLKFGMPVTYTPIGFVPNRDVTLDSLDSPTITFENPEQYTVSGVAKNWDFQGGLVYRTYNSAIATLLRDEATLNRVRDNLAWYGCIEGSYGSNQIRICKFTYPAVITESTNARNARRQSQRVSTNNSLLKRIIKTGAWQNSNTPIPGAEFLATCTTERNLKVLMNNFVENGESYRLSYAIPESQARYRTDETMGFPMEFSNSWVAAGWNRALSTSSSGRGTQRRTESRDGFTPRGIVTEVKFDSEACGPIFSGTSERAWRAKRSPFDLTAALGFIINYPVRTPRIMR
jgi:hypothetical protein